jgi:predicted dehydrogenase
LINIALVGYGYWGPNLARVFSSQKDCKLVSICEKTKDRAELAALHFPNAKVTERYQDLLNDPSIHLILIATPVSSHFQLAKDAILAGKDVFVEKPLTHSISEATELVQLAETHKRILAVDHTFIYTGAIQEIKRLLDTGSLGEILYFDSVRINLGLFQHDVNVVYDLAAHDLAILFHLIQASPIAIQAMGACHSGNDIENIGYIHLEFPNNFVAHLHLNWLAPVKIRRTLIGGTKKMIVYDDMEPSEKVKVYDKGIVLKEGDTHSLHKVLVDYRTGDMIAPKLPHKEALVTEAEHVVSCVKNRTKPLTDGIAGLRVVQVLESSQISIKNKGMRIELPSLI